MKFTHDCVKSRQTSINEHRHIHIERMQLENKTVHLNNGPQWSITKRTRAHNGIIAQESDCTTEGLTSKGLCDIRPHVRRKKVKIDQQVSDDFFSFYMGIASSIRILFIYHVGQKTGPTHILLVSFKRFYRI